MKKITTYSFLETIQIAQNLGSFLKKGDVILLDGDLGAGKTTFTKGIAISLGIISNITSPSFTIMKRYQANDLFFNHLDLYRLHGSDNDFDLVEYIADPDAISVIEWPFQARGLLPDNYLLITINYIGENEREFILTPKGVRYEEIIDKLCVT